MAVPNTGPLGLRAQIGNEFYGNVTGSNISIHEMAVAEGFETPDAFSEFYGYSSVVTVTLNGGQDKTGTPGSSGFGSLYFDVSAPSGRGFTNSDASAASLNAGLPSAFTSNFQRTGTSNGRWYITTPDGNFPNDNYALQSGDFTISNPSTPLYTLSVTWTGTWTGTSNSTVFQGSQAGVGVGRSIPYGIALLWSDNGQGSGSGVSVTGFGAGSVSQGVSAYRTMNGNFSTTVSTYGNSSDMWAATPFGAIPAPPWGNPPTTYRGAAFAQAAYGTNSSVDPRVSANLSFNWGNGQDNRGIYIDRGPGYAQYFSSWFAGGIPPTGTYYVQMQSNHQLNTSIATSPSWPYSV